MRQRVTLVALIVLVGIIDVVEILRTNSVAQARPRFQVTAPATAPNVLIMLIDAMGFGQSSAFGGPVHMPTTERLANEGLRYNEFHTVTLMPGPPHTPQTEGQ